MPTADVDWDAALSWLHQRTGVELAPGQREAVRLALTEKVAVLTGGPGCGKRFTVRSIVTLAVAKGTRVVLAAPTGRAAKRLTELTGVEAVTVHRLLVGDVDQLPSVGAGEVLRDLLVEGTPIPHVRLTQVFRQASRSGVVTNAHRINAGSYPQVRGLDDFFLFSTDDAEETAGLTVDVAVRRIPARFGLDPRRDVQVLTPMHRGPAGAAALNTLLQEALTPAHPDRPEKRFGGRIFRVGDKVTQIRNNYDKGSHGVFNGTQGVVTAIDPVGQTLTVVTDEDETIDYDFGELDELVHAYAVTVHRSQGSEYPCVVVPLTTSAWMMLQRNLLYTAVTRAKKLVVLVGSPRALGQAVRTTGSGRRHTALAHRLRGALHRSGATPIATSGRTVPV